jgi:DNA-binding NarL/FixJ family response regulator
METTHILEAQAQGPLRVFVAEDSPLIQSRLDEMLAACGADQVGNARNVASATRLILETHPDVVILDIQLADGTGFDVLRAIHDQAPEIEVLLFSNFAADPYRQLAERLGARGFFDKAKEFSQLRDAVAQRAAAKH